MIPSFIDQSLLPHRPGIYIFKDSVGKPLYVGKGIDLYHRVSSYFPPSHLSSGKVKTSTLVERITKVETIIVESELEALILEANLIKQYLPPFNVRLTDDKDYLYIALTKSDFPQVITARKTDLAQVKKYFGPFPSSTTVKQTLRMLRRVFPWCSNPPGRHNKTHRPCFYFHLNLCPGACVGEINNQDYHQITNQFSKFLEGKKAALVEELTKDMEAAAAKLEFEEAARLKRTISGIGYLTQSNRVSQYLANPNFLEDERTQALKKLQQDLNLAELPERIEAYDISNFAGKEATGSMVVLTSGEVDKSQYRRFKIKISGKPNDVGMHKEMMRRRLNHPEWPLPQLMLIDGGRGQVRGIWEVVLNYPELVSGSKQQILKRVQNDRLVGQIPVFGLAKRTEWLYPPEGEVVKLPKRSLALRLLQKIRDESHRFALNYHRKLRQSALRI